MDSLFIGKSAEVIIGEHDGEPVGLPCFFHNLFYSLGSKAGDLFIEDLYVRPRNEREKVTRRKEIFLSFFSKNWHRKGSVKMVAGGGG